jgi:hypothetical protein
VAERSKILIRAAIKENEKMEVMRKVTSKVYGLTKSGNQKVDEVRIDTIHDDALVPLKYLLTRTLGGNRYIYTIFW